MTTMKLGINTLLLSSPLSLGGVVTPQQLCVQLVRFSMNQTWTVVGVGNSPRVPPFGIPGEEDKVGSCEQFDFNP